MTSIQVSLSTENSKYVSLFARVSGGTASKIINAALDDKRQKDAALIDEINALISRIGIEPTTHPGKKTEADAEAYAERTAREIERRELAGKQLGDPFESYYKR